MERVQRLREAARHTMKTLTWDHIMGQMKSVLLETVRAQRKKHDRPELAATTD